MRRTYKFLYTFVASCYFIAGPTFGHSTSLIEDTRK